MIQSNTFEPERIRDRLAGHHILVTGSTGFLAKAFVEKLLRSVDTLGSIHLLVRARSDGVSPRQRVWKEVFGSRAYDRIRAAMGEGFAELRDKKIHVVGGDLTKERLGLTPQDYEDLTRRITLVVNSAATVTFDEQIDLAVELNTLGPSRLLRFARDCGNVPFLHVSTCYVCGVRTGTVVEDFSAPECAKEALPHHKEAGGFDLDACIESIRAEAGELRHRFGVDTDACRRELGEAGMKRARLCGWNDTYTFTKWMGEQLLIRDRGEVPLVIFRPAIIEGGLNEPLPGWIDGLRMADPIIMAFGRGKLREFPAKGELAIDLIPVDYVANAMIATLPVGQGWGKDLAVYHCASSERNPLLLRDMGMALTQAFVKRPLSDDNGRPIHVKPLKLVEQNTFLKCWHARKNRVAQLQKVLKAIGIRGRRYRKLSGIIRQIEQVIYFAKIYSPYTHLTCTFSDDALCAVNDRLHPDDRTTFPFDVKNIDWEDYIVNRHVPGLRTFVLGPGSEPTPRVLADRNRNNFRESEVNRGSEVNRESEVNKVLGETNIFSAFKRAAEVHADKPALQIWRDGRWVHYTYRQALLATGAIMQRFIERGLKRGDRVAICGESCPEWGLTYLAAMRAGLTAVPLDPQLQAADAWSEARFAAAKLICATPATAITLAAHRNHDDPELVEMREPFIPRPGAMRDAAPDPVAMDASGVASILFTSGTTVSPKAVQLTHRNFMANAKALVSVHPAHPADQLLSVLPMYHAFEFTGGFLVPLFCGATITYVDELKGAKILSAMQETGTTIMLVVPRLLRMFCDSIENNVASSGFITRALFRMLGFLSNRSGHRFGRQLFGTVHRRFGGRLRMFVSGGSRLEPDLFESFDRMGFRVYEGYGLTETSPVLAVNPPDLARAGSVGVPLPGVSMEIRSTNLEGIGRVWVRGDSVMVGYLNNPEATEAVLVNGWFHTGDLGRRDEDGYLFLTGRSTDLIVTGAGKNVYPDEIEARYRELPHSKELCVFGMPSEEGLGDTVHAAVVLDVEATVGLDRSTVEREIRMAVASIGESLATHERIAALHFWDCDLPKTSTLKAKRGLIREMVLAKRVAASAGASGSETSPTIARSVKAGETAKEERDRFAAVCRILANQTRRPADTIRPDMHLLLDLGIDSIGKMDLLGTIESHFGMQIDGENAARIARISDLLKTIGPRHPKSDVKQSVGLWQRQFGETDATACNNESSAALLPMRWLVRGSVFAFMNSYVRVTVRGHNNIPKRGAFILAPNHSSHLDSPSVLAAIGGLRRVWVAGAEDYFFSTPLKRLVFGRLLDTIPFDRRTDGVLGLRRCGEALRKGDGLLMFPEGTRSATGVIQPFKIGVAVLAVERGVPIVPVYIDRAYQLFRKGQRLVRPGTITVTFGRPIDPPNADQDNERYEAFQSLTRQVQHAVTGLANGANG